LLTAPIHQDAVELLRGVAEVVVSDKPLRSEDELMNVVKDFDAVISMGVEPFTKRVLENSSRLLIVARHGVGYDNIDVDAATRLGIWVTITPVEELFDAVADHAIALLLCITRKICVADSFVRLGKWFEKPFDKQLFIGIGLRGKTLGIVGLGRIGARIAERAKGFGLKVIYYDIERKIELEKRLGVEFSQFDYLLKNSDFIVVSVPLTEKTRGLIGERELYMMKQNAILINISRGAVVDHKALVKALKSGRLAGAALDVFHVEPIPPTDEIVKLPNTVLTPHIAWLTEESRRAMAMRAAENVIKVLNGEEPLDAINPTVKEFARNKRVKGV